MDFRGAPLGGPGDFRIRHLTSALVLAATLTACAASTGTTRGVVFGVEGDLSEVRSFTVFVSEEEIVEFVPAEDGSFAFPLSHLREHLRSGEPVVVQWEMIDGVRHAVSVSDG